MYIEYKLNARKIERQFKRMLIKKGTFHTAQGCRNYLVEYGKTYLEFKSEKGVVPQKIKRRSIRQVISFFFFKRTTVRKDLERYSSFTSALFGILLQCFKDKARLLKLRAGLYRLSLLGTRFFFSGLERDPAMLKILKDLNGKYVLFNYKNILESPQCLQMLDTYDLFCVVDSGAFSIFNKKRKSSKQLFHQSNLFDNEKLDEMTLEGYAQFINSHKNNKRILGFFPLDCIGDPEQTKVNYERLKELTDANIFPVWQITDSLEGLNQLVKEEPEMIGLGGCVPFLSSRKHIVRDILDQVTKRYPNVCFHGLGLADEMLLEFNLFSADSTSFLNARKWEGGDKIYLSNGERINAPESMSTIDIIKQNIQFLLGLEEIKSRQLSFPELLVC
ncbi:hypothetical protein NVV31_23050 [Cytobacillus firmus]|uniref:hypothetical protein n=1 Tax=Cytobacillus firmus TaxID=1399 RepID=UPI0021C994FD|nr:hypothetical protein [Cytobacillus firmus]MCU1808252.1 hypothetical protein [Cytobacillus firmus]